jgi:predicted dehydrogenase
MRIAIVGLGWAGRIYLDALRSLPDVEIAAVTDIAPAARAAATAAGLPAYAGVEEMLAAEAPVAVVLSTPPATHAAMAVECLRRGVHVLCEKPLALSTWDVLRMLQTANSVHRKLLVASKFRHVAEIQRARELLAAGDLGDPVAFEISFCSPVDMSRRWNAQPEVSGGGVIRDNGCHAFDIACYLFGNAHRVLATRLKSMQPVAVEDSATMQVWAGEDVIGRIDVSWSLTPARDSYLVVHGTRASLEIGWRSSRLHRPRQTPIDMGGAYDKLAAHRGMLACFVGAISDRSEPWISAPECLQVVAAVDAAYRSLESGTTEWVSIQGNRELSLISLSAPAAPDALSHTASAVP